MMQTAQEQALLLAQATEALGAPVGGEKRCLSAFVVFGSSTAGPFLLSSRPA